MNRSICLLLASVGFAQSADFTWKGDGADTRWDHASNWNPGTGVPGADDSAVITSVKGVSTIILGGDTQLRSLTFDPGALNACRIEGHSLALADGSTVIFKKLPADVGNGKTATQTIASGLRLSGKVNFANQNRHYLGGEKLHIAGEVTGGGVFVVGGVRHGIVQLSGDNSKYTGSFLVETGSLMLSHSAALGSGKDPVKLNGGAFVIGARVSTTHAFHVAASADWDSHGPNGTHDGTITIDQSATFSVKNGGGNTMTWRGMITGAGDLKFAAHGTTFSGDKANTLSGTVTVGGARGATILARDKGVNVIAGPLVMDEMGTLRWESDEQIADASSITFAGALPMLELNGHSETVGTLDLQGDGHIDLGGSDGRLQFSSSNTKAWDPEKVLLIHHGGKGGGVIRFGNDHKALTEDQLRQIGFVDPGGLAPGTYTAKITDGGEVVPTGTLVAPVGLPIELTDKARERRRELYEVNGIAKLTGARTPLLKEGIVISVFGDSITWGGGYLKILGNALETGEGTKELGVKLINHGVNGGGVLAIRDGDEGEAHFGNTKPLPFAEVIATDKADIAVIFIGVNDVWWRKTPPEVFEKAMRDLVAQAKANGTAPVLATLAIMKEEVGNRNSKCDAFADITRKVAADTGATLVDLRSAFMACMENESIVVRPGGTWKSDGKWLTHDGVHANSRGNQLIADQIANGIFSASAK